MAKETKKQEEEFKAHAEFHKKMAAFEKERREAEVKAYLEGDNK